VNQQRTKVLTRRRRPRKIRKIRKAQGSDRPRRKKLLNRRKSVKKRSREGTEKARSQRKAR
jgi:hypothetical protein